MTLPLEEYNRLLELANKSPTKSGKRATSLHHQARRPEVTRCERNGDRAVQLQGETFNKGETKVALTSGMTILDARQEGKGLPLEQEGGTQTAILAGPAEFTVVLDVGLPLSIETGRASFSLPVPSAGSVRPDARGSRRSHERNNQSWIDY